jgi:uncharacterized protein
MAEIKIITDCTGFDWDEANIDKNWSNHQVLPGESEQIFFNEPLLLYDDTKHSHTESRYYVLGKTDAGRKLFVAFTIRKNLIRVISARDMSRKESKIYEEI